MGEQTQRRIADQSRQWLNWILKALLMAGLGVLSWVLLEVVGHGKLLAAQDSQLTTIEKQVDALYNHFIGEERGRKKQRR